MRQAGRYLPEYQKIRQKTSFMEMVKTPELAAEITLQPIRRFDLDAAIIFSDILVIPEAMGMKLNFIDGEGPKFEASVLDLPAETTRCSAHDVMERLGFGFKAIELVKRELTQKNPGKISLIGFSGAPFTLAAYMIEGGSSKNFVRTKAFMFDDPHGFRKLLEILTELVIIYLKKQVQAGAQVVQVFDSWAGILSPLDYANTVLPANQKIFQQLNPFVPTIYYSNSTSGMMENLLSVGAQILSVDWRMNLSDAIKRISASGQEIGLQGNLDPAVLFAGKKCIEEKTKQILAEGKNAHRHIFNLGHGILPETPISAVETLIETVHAYS
jgi:uroporphyrinogen decarboxylase